MDGVPLSELTRDRSTSRFNICLHSSIDYIYLLFWNSIWTIAPVIGIGLFDRILGNTQYLCINCLPSDSWTDAKLLMDIPELYHYGRRGTWFNVKSFLIYMFDGFVQVRARGHWFHRSNLHVQATIIYFLIFYTYTSTTSRKDGYDVYLYEFSTVCPCFRIKVHS